MNAEEFRLKIYKISYSCEMNQRYHQLQAHKWWRWDKFVKILVGLLAVIALVTTFISEEYKFVEILAASLAAVAAIILNVVPVGEWESHYSEMFRAWSDLLSCAAHVEIKSRKYHDDQDVPELLADRYSELVAEENQLNSLESAPNMGLLRCCQEDVNERMWGRGIRTFAEVERERRKREQEPRPPVSAVGAQEEAQV